MPWCTRAISSDQSAVNTRDMRKTTWPVEASSGRERASTLTRMRAAGSQVRGYGQSGARHLEPANVGGACDDVLLPHCCILDSTPRHPVFVFALRLVLLACMLTRRPPHTVGDAPSLVAGGPREIPFQAPVRILQAPRREVASDGM